MLGMLGLSGFKMAAIAAVVAVVATIIGALYWQNSNLTAEVAVLNENNGKLEAAVSTQQAAIDAYKDAQAEWSFAFEDLQDRLLESERVAMQATEEKRRLNDLFTKHNLTALTLAKPGLIERRINSGTAGVWSVLHDLTAGSADGGRGSGAPAGETAPAEPATD